MRSVVIRPKTIAPRIVSGPAPAASPASRPPGPDATVGDMVERAAEKYNVDPLLVHSMIKVESNYNQFAISPKGAQGLMQLMPGTARRFGVSNSFDAQANIDAGVRYLRQLTDLFGDPRKVLAAYNAGEGAVARYNWIPPYPETYNYVVQVARRWAAAKKAAAKARPSPAAASEDKPRPVLKLVDEQGRIFLRTP